jgi:UDP-N-acetylglucosamine 2-epimerase (hydrolysing)
MKKPHKVLFLTGTRADFGKLKSLMSRMHASSEFEVHVFVTGMHMLSKYGYTCEEVEKAGLPNIYKFINQNANDGMDHILGKTIAGISDYVREIEPDLMVVHGDRVETLAGASVGALNNILTGHIEGGEVSGTVDELIRHAVSKMSHIHFVSTNEARTRLIQLGEAERSIFVIGSPDVDVMKSSSLPSIDTVRNYYEFPFKKYGILLFHPVTSETKDLQAHIKCVVDEVIESGLNYIVIYPNNDTGTDIIFNEYKRLEENINFKFYPSMRFEYFLSLLKNAEVVVGNSSAGVREAPHYGVPAVNIGTRQQNRVTCDAVVNVGYEVGEINYAINEVTNKKYPPEAMFGEGDSDKKFLNILSSEDFWKTEKQKYFIDQNYSN